MDICSGDTPEAYGPMAAPTTGVRHRAAVPYAAARLCLAQGNIAGGVGHRCAVPNPRGWVVPSERAGFLFEERRPLCIRAHDDPSFVLAKTTVLAGPFSSQLRATSLELPPSVNIHIRPCAELFGPLFDLRLEARGFQQTADLVADLGEGLQWEAAGAALVAPGAFVVGLDLVLRDEDERREVFL